MRRRSALAFAGQLLGGQVVDHSGFRILLVIDAALMLVVIFALAFDYRDMFRPIPKSRCCAWQSSQ
jgi:predicted MFS family arabinose efflux permease